MTAKIGLLTCMGTSFLIPLLREMKRQGVEPAAILIDGKVSDRDLSIEKNRIDPDFKFVDLYDEDIGDVPCYFTGDHNSERCVALVKRLGLEFLANAGTPRILKEPILSATRGVINCHPGMLPDYRGCTCLEWSIHHGDPVGATAHFMTAKIDEGPIICKEPMVVKPGEQYRTVRTNIIYHLATVLTRAFREVSASGFRMDQLAASSGGRYFKPIPAELLADVKVRLAEGKYRSG